MTKEERWKAMLWTDDFSDLTSAGGFDIPLTEERAISAAQLDLLVDHTRRRLKCGPWTVDRRSADGTWSKYSLTLTSEVSLYDLNSNVILPVTSERQCSMVELLATAVQRPDYFVSCGLCTLLSIDSALSIGQPLVGRAHSHDAKLHTATPRRQST